MVYELNHPIAFSELAIIRDENTDTKEFRSNINNLSRMLFYEATRDMKTFDKEVTTPITKTVVKTIDEKDIVIVPILRAGLGMSEALFDIVPNAINGHIGLMRDEVTKEPIEYLVKLPKGIEDKNIFLVDPMLATGGSLVYAIKLLLDKGCKNIKALCIIAAPEGIDKVKEAYPDVDIYVASIDEKLNENKYIVPGLGDAGDRIFGTK